jgi:hypothetical protein
VLILGGGAALGYALTRKAPSAAMSPDQIAAMASAIEKLDGRLQEAHSIARVRAETISQNDYLRNGVKTKHPPTVMDQFAKGEGRVDPAKGEVIEVGWMDERAYAVLASQPPDAKPITYAGQPASYTSLGGDHVMIYEVVVLKEADKPVGYVTVAQSRGLEDSFDLLAAAGISGRFELGAAQAQIGGVLPADARTETKLLQEPGAKLVVASPKTAVAASSTPLIAGGAGAAGLGLLLLVLGMLARKQPAVAAVQPPVPGQTQLTGSYGVASGTPSPAVAGGFSINPSNIGAGAMIGRWEVIRRLGSGGMADVHLARSKGEAGFEKVVAIKVMHGHLARNERAVEHFLDEARLAAHIHHPNVVAIQDLGKIGNDYVIVMEHVDGVDLERLLASARDANRPVPIDVGLGILCRICDGLNAAHTAVGPDGVPLGIIHRDVKSANVLVSKQGGVKVVDFGIAKATVQSHLTAAGETKGTPSMMAPEQRVGELVDVRADVYSVAAVGFEILTGHAVNLDLAALAHLGVENWPHLPLPSSLRPQLPHELDQILMSAMAFDRERRPADCQVFEAMLEAVMKQQGFAATDKDIARWVDVELRQLSPPFEGTTSSSSKPAGIS